jgi:hypothetical protein
MKLTSYIRSYECPQETVEGAIKLFDMCKDMDFVVPGKVGMGVVDKTMKDSEDVYIESLPMFDLHEFGMDYYIKHIEELAKIILTVYTWVTTN